MPGTTRRVLQYRHALLDAAQIKAEINFRDVISETEWVNIADCEGKISAQNFGLFPPCVPLVKRGEQITKETLALLQKADNVFGVYEEKLLVFKGEEV